MSKYDSDEFSDFFNTNSSNSNYNHPKSNKYNTKDSYASEDEDFDDYSQNLPYNNTSRDNHNSSRKNNNMSEKKSGNINSEEIKMRKKLRNSKKLGTFMGMIQLIVSIAFMVVLFFARTSISSLVTIPIYTGIGVILFLLFLIALVMQSKRLLVKRLGKAISSLVIIFLLVTTYFLYPLIGVTLGGKEKVSTKPFVLYLSADDHFGEISSNNNGRSDTNILAIVNPKTYTALLLSTPRDAYVELIGEDIPKGNYDKLTHGGLYGTGVKNEDGSWGHGYNVLMDILGSLYDIDVEHYLRLNFTGFIDLVDNLGGVTIDIPEGFSTYTYGKNYTFDEGVQTLNGEEALTYVRERKSFAQGDIQRGKNQVAMIKALINQALSTNTITNYSNIIKSIANSFETDIDVSSLAALQLQLQGEKDYDGWNIVSYSVEGNTGGGYQHCYWTDSYLSVVSLDDDSIGIAQNLVEMVLNGDEVTDNTIDELSTTSED